MTFGAPSGALGGSNGPQSGTESRMSTLIWPLNGSGTTPSSDWLLARHLTGLASPTRRLPRGAPEADHPLLDADVVRFLNHPG